MGAVHQFEKGIFVRIVVPAVEPVYFIASDQMVVHRHDIVPDACREQLFARIEGDQIFFQLSGQRGAQKVFGQADPVCNKTVDEAIKYAVQ